MTTGERIRQLRIEHQMTQEELGARIGVQKAAIYKYENGLVVNLKRSILEKLAIVLDTTPTYLMGMEDSAQQANVQLTPQQSTLLAVFDQLNEAGQEICGPKLRTCGKKLLLNPNRSCLRATR